MIFLRGRERGFIFHDTVQSPRLSAPINPSADNPKALAANHDLFSRRSLAARAFPVLLLFMLA